MIIYTFKGGTEIVQIRADPLLDWEIRINNATFKTGDKFVSIRKVLGKKGKILTDALMKMYDDYLIKEFGGMGYKLVNKNDTSRKVME